MKTILKSWISFFPISSIFCLSLLLLTIPARSQSIEYEEKLDSLSAQLDLTEDLDSRLVLMDSIRRLDGLQEEIAIQYWRKIISEGSSDPLNDIVVNGYISMGEHHYYGGTLDSALHYANEGHKRSAKIKNITLLSGSLSLIGGIYDLKGDSDSTLHYFTSGYNLNTVTSIQEEKYDIIQTFGNNLGSYFLNRGDTRKAIGYYQEAVEAANRLGNLYAKGVILNNIGMIYGESGDYEKNIEYAKESLKAKSQIKQKSSLFYTYANLFDTYLDIKSYDSLLVYGNKAIKLTEEIGVDDYKYWMSSYVAAAELRVGNEEKAYELLKPYLYVIDDTESFDHIKSKYCESLIEVRIVQGEYEKAEEALRILEKWAYNSDRDLYDGIYPYKIQIYNALGKKDSVSDAILEYHAYNAEKAKEKLDKLGEIEAEYTNYENVQKVESLEQEKALITAVSLRNKIAALSGLTIALLTLFFLYRNKQKNRIITDQNQQLVSLNQSKDQIFSIIGHDLRKPAVAFSNISGSINYLIQKEDYDTLNKMGAEIEREGFALQKLTDNLLDWALSQRDIFPYKPSHFGLREKTEEVLSSFHNIADQKGLTLVNDVLEQTVVYADPNATFTILMNLLDNAIKFTPRGGQVKVGSTEQDGKVQLVITDTGVGMTTEQLSDLFSLAKGKSHKGTAGESGTGLGLHLVNELVKMNKGEISGESALGNGTTFKVQLPMAG